MNENTIASQFELHITPQKDFVEDFIDIAQRFKLKTITHTNYSISGKALYSEVMLAEKCKDLSELNQKLELLIRTARHHNLLRIKIETNINNDFSYNAPYKMGSNYYELHIDIETEINDDVNNICTKYNCAISKNPEKDTFMLTFRCNTLETYKYVVKSLLSDLELDNIKYTRVLKEYCFCDDNLSVDDPWLNRN